MPITSNFPSGAGLPDGGSTGQILTKTEQGAVWSDPPDTGVTTFSGRTGAVTPQEGDYTADMVGARPSDWVPSADDVGAIPTGQKGAPNGVAELDGSGLVPASQLPSYVDDVVEVASYSALPQTGEDGKIYVVEDTNLQYRWSGTQYVEISKSLALGETSSTAYRGDLGKAAYDHSQITGNPHNTTAADVGARPDTWMPSAADVGARPATWMPTAADVGARPSSWTPTAAQVGAIPAPSGGSAGQVLTKTSSGQAWQAVPTNVFHVGTSAPSDKKLLWIDTTSSTGGLKYHNGSSWVHVPVAYT